MPGNIRPIAPVRIDPNRPDPALIQHAAQTIQSGGVIIFPTSGLYGLGADATNRDAVHRIFQIKRRVTKKPILVLIQNADQLDRWVTTLPEMARNLIDRHWPGGITLIFKARQHLPTNLTAGTEKIGIRVPAHPVARALVESVDFPVTATSANIADDPGCAAINDLPPSLIEDVDLILDAGTLSGGKGSTVVDVTAESLKILRSGTVPTEQIFSIKKPPFH